MDALDLDVEQRVGVEPRLGQLVEQRPEVVGDVLGVVEQSAVEVGDDEVFSEPAVKLLVRAPDLRSADMAALLEPEMGELTQITRDDTFVQTLVDEGRITAEQAHTHPQRSLIMRALTGTEVEPTLTIREARAGDRYLLCSDGLSDVVSEEITGAGEEMTARLGEPLTAEQTARAWRTALDPGGEWIPAVLAAPDGAGRDDGAARYSFYTEGTADRLVEPVPHT
mgnify:CR=1 FL=1